MVSDLWEKLLHEALTNGQRGIVTGGRGWGKQAAMERYRAALDRGDVHVKPPLLREPDMHLHFDKVTVTRELADQLNARVAAAWGQPLRTCPQLPSIPLVPYRAPEQRSTP